MRFARRRIDSHGFKESKPRCGFFETMRVDSSSREAHQGVVSLKASHLLRRLVFDPSDAKQTHPFYLRYPRRAGINLLSCFLLSLKAQRSDPFQGNRQAFADNLVKSKLIPMAASTLFQRFFSALLGGHAVVSLKPSQVTPSKKAKMV